MMAAGLLAKNGNGYQDENRRGKMGRGQLFAHPGVEDFSEILSLTQEQQEQIREIFNKHREEIRDEVRPDRDQISREDRLAMKKEFRQQLYEEILPILDEKQKKILNEMKSEFEAGKIPDLVINHRVDKLADNLELTDSQKGQLKTVYSEFGKKIIQLRDGEESREVLQDKMRETFSDLNSRLEAILTPAQMEKMKMFRNERMTRRGERRGMRQRGRQREQIIEKVKDELDLSEEQETKIDAILEKSRLAMKEKMKESDESRREIFRAHKEETADAIKEVLTSEQQEKFEEMKDKFLSERNRGGRGYRQRSR